MKQLKPLLYLTVRSLTNGARRALTTPRRLISFLLFVGYYFFLFMRPAFMSSRPPVQSMNGVQLDFPALPAINALVFAIFAVISIFQLLSVVSYQNSFKPADVDVLFSTPISPKIVLSFRIFRDYLVTLLMPFVFALLGIRGAKMGWEGVFRNMPHPEYSGLALRAMTISWILVALGWVSLSHAVTLYLNRSDARSDRIRRIAGWSITALIACVGVYCYFNLTEVGSVSELITFSHSPVLRVVFFMASFATMVTMAPFTGSIAMAALGVACMLAVIGVGMHLAFRQVGWLYDEATIRTAQATKARQLMRSGDYMAIVAERARSGKVKAKRRSWVHRLRMSGPLSLIWKELLLQPRSMMGGLVILALMSIVFSVMPALMESRALGSGQGYFYLGMQGASLLMVAVSIAQSGSAETLRRVDLLKPLPFPPSKIVFFEIASKSVLPVVCNWVGGVAAFVIRPSLWPFILGGAVFVPILSLLLNATVFLVTVLFPDVDDPTQRQFRGLVTLLAFGVCGFFPVGLFAGSMALGAAPYVAALIASIPALGITLLLSVFTGQLYATFNPSE